MDENRVGGIPHAEPVHSSNAATVRIVPVQLYGKYNHKGFEYIKCACSYYHLTTGIYDLVEYTRSLKHLIIVFIYLILINYNTETTMYFYW